LTNAKFPFILPLSARYIEFATGGTRVLVPMLRSIDPIAALAQQVIAYRAGLDTPGRVMLWASDRFGLAFDISDATEVEQ